MLRIVAILAALAAFLLTAWAGQGYIGMATDDYYYVSAAQCTLAHGWCLPTTHWAARYPFVASLAGALWALPGEPRLALQLAGSAWTAAALGATAWVAALLDGRRTALLTVLILMMVGPLMLANGAVHIGAAELALLALSAALALLAVRRGGVAVAMAAGVAGGLAVGVRPTAALSLVPVGLFLLIRAPRLALVTAAAGAGVLAAEAAALALSGADPLTGWRLALGHTRIPSSELPGSVDTSRSPLFNADIIAGWRKASDVSVHWLLDPLLNLAASAELRLLFLLTAALLVRQWRAVPGWVKWVAAFCAWQILASAYMLAIDPKPRMFLPAWAGLAVIAAALMAREARPMVAYAVVIVGMLLPAKALVEMMDMRAIERQAVAILKADRALAPDSMLARSLLFAPMPTATQPRAFLSLRDPRYPCDGQLRPDMTPTLRESATGAPAQALRVFCVTDSDRGAWLHR